MFPAVTMAMTMEESGLFDMSQSVDGEGGGWRRCTMRMAQVEWKGMCLDIRDMLVA